MLVPVAGALIIGLMARYGSERIRGHGIPEAIESILINGSRVEPRLAILKPLSSAISIGIRRPVRRRRADHHDRRRVRLDDRAVLPSDQRRAQDAAGGGAAAGMSATFAAPVAAVLLAVELLLFEWKPRSLIPVALASATAGAARRYILGLGPLFPGPAASRVHRPGRAARLRASCGLLAGVLSALLTWRVYAAEDAFQKLPIHWMWWPAIGGLVVGLGGLIFPQALGVGYDTIGALLQGDVAAHMIARHSAGEVDHLGGLARLRHLRRRAGAAADDGRRAGRRRSACSCRTRARASGRWSAWARFSAAPCARRSPASSSRSS